MNRPTSLSSFVRRARLLACALVLPVTLLLAPTPGRAQEAPATAAASERTNPRESDVPPSLRPWIPWVLAELDREVCPKIAEVSACEWPGRLELELGARSGEFRFDVYVDATTFVALPGDPGLWPLDVQDRGKNVAVLEPNGRPVVELTRGAHELRGRFEYSRLPETLTLGDRTAFVELRLDGKSIPLLKRENGKLWLKGLEVDADGSTEKEHVELSVFRRIEDGVPLRVETRIVFQVAGRAREIALPAPLLAGTVPLSVSGDLAVALEPNGTLRAQLVPGRHEVSLRARTRGLPSEFPLEPRALPWPEREVWVFVPNPTERVVELSGAAGIDASRTELPEDWKTFGAYSIVPGEKLVLVTTRRGEPQVPPNRLSLSREFWLDEAAGAFTVRDSLSGEMHQNFRLDLASGELGQVDLAGQPQVITKNPTDGLRGVEVRDGQLALVATSRVPRATDLAAVGWTEDVESLGVTLHLPPGWDVFAATGVDTMGDTWLGRWDLFAVFYVLVLTLATAKLAGRLAGGVAFVALVLAHAESGAPEYVWLVLVVLGALTKLVRSERWLALLRIAFYGVALTLSIALVSFAVTQVRSALYPHLETSLDVPLSLGMEGGSGMMAKEEAMNVAAAPEPAAPPPVEAQTEQAPLDRAQTAEKKIADESDDLFYAGRRGAGSAKSRASVGHDVSQKQFQPNAIVQTGPGLPDVVTTTWNLSWSGPVVRGHEMRLFLISPALDRVLTVLRLAALGAFAFLLWRNLPRPGLPSFAPGRAAATALVLALPLLATFLAPRLAHAEEPGPERLAELRTRLVKPPACAPNCISVSSLDLELARGITIASRVHAGAVVAYKLPGPASVLGHPKVRVDGRETAEIRLEADGAYYLRLTPGVHEVVLSSDLPSDRTTLDLGTTPRRVRVDAEGWVVSGVNDHGLVEGGTITIVRTVPLPSSEDEGDARPKQGELNVPPWFRVTRTIGLGVSGFVRTVVERVSDPTLPEVLALPLLPGEQVTTPGVEIRDGTALLSFPREVTSFELLSTLLVPKEAGATLEYALVSPKEASYSEVWRLECGVVWRCRTEGLVPISHLAEGRWLETFSPWPGETLRITARAPLPADGQSLTIERSLLSLTPGVRMSQGRLEFRVRTSRSQVHTIRIPEAARLERVEVDGKAQAARNEKGAIRLSLSPGAHDVTIAWQSDDGLTTLFRTPPIDLGAAGVNQRTVIELPEERWLLFAGGPSHGPAILFWGYLVILAALALLLPRLPGNLRKPHEWFLLGLGLTQIPIAIAFLVVSWFFLVGSREKWSTASRLKKNFAQLVLIVMTVVFLGSLTGAVYEGLVSSPDMDVEGAGSYGNHLAWYVDRSPARLSGSWTVSVSIWVWRGLMLAWALWLARSLLKWLTEAWELAQVNGFWAAHPNSRESDAAKSPPRDGANDPTEDEARDFDERLAAETPELEERVANLESEGGPPPPIDGEDRPVGAPTARPDVPDPEDK